MTSPAPHAPRDGRADRAAAGPPQAPERRRWWHAENAEQDLLRILITSPWQRYRLDRDAAEPDEGSLSS